MNGVSQPLVAKWESGRNKPRGPVAILLGQLELRIDMRKVYPNLNVIAPAPEGETEYRGPVRFEPASPPAERLDITVAEEGGGVVLTLRYGDRRLSLKLTP